MARPANPRRLLALPLLLCCWLGATAQAPARERPWSGTIVVGGLAGLRDGFNGPAVYPGISARLLRRAGGLLLGLEVGYVSTGRAASELVCLDPGTCERLVARNFFRGSLWHAGLCLRSGARASMRAPYFVSGIGIYNWSRDYEWKQMRPDTDTSGPGISLGVGWRPVLVGRHLALGLEARGHGMLAFGSDALGAGALGGLGLTATFP